MTLPLEPPTLLFIGAGQLGRRLRSFYLPWRRWLCFIAATCFNVAATTLMLRVGDAFTHAFPTLGVQQVAAGRWLP